MTNYPADDVTLLTHANYQKESHFSFKNIAFYLSMVFALAAFIYCWYSIMRAKQAPVELQQIQQAIEEIRASKANKMPDNIELVLQDLIAQLQAQKSTIRDLESLVASDLKPQVYFLLKEYAANQQQPASQGQILNLNMQENASTQAMLAKVLVEADFAGRGLHDLKQTKNLLEFAGQILSTNKEEKYNKLKAAIAADQQTLATMQQPDKTQIWLKITDLLAQINVYEYKKPATVVPVNVVAELAPAETDNFPSTSNKWSLALEKTWAQFKALVKIKRNNNAASLAATFVTLNEDTQRERLGLILEQARTASILGEEKIYAASLHTAKELLTNYFVASNTLTQQVQAELDFLAGINLQQQFPALLSLAEFAAMNKPEVEH